MAAKRKGFEPAILAVTAVYLVTLIHHVYGGLAFSSAQRLLLALVFTLVFAATAGLFRAAATRRWARRAYSSVVVGFWIVLLGLYEGGFNHSLYLVLRSTAIDEATLRRLYPAGSDAAVSDDVFFQATGVLTLIAAAALAVILVATGKRARAAKAGSA